MARQLGVGDESLRSLGQAVRDRRRQAGRAHDRRAGRARSAAQGEQGAAPRQRHPAGGRGFLRGGARPPTQEVVAFIDAHRDNETGGLDGGSSRSARSSQSPPPPTTTPRPGHPRPGPFETPSSDRPWRLWKHNYSVYGRRKLGRRPDGPATTSGETRWPASCAARASAGRRRAKKRSPPSRTPTHVRAPDLVDRNFSATPDQLWVADFTYCSTWSGIVYVAFVIDVFSRRLVGWRAARSMTTDLVLDALNMAAWTRRHTTSTA